MSFGSCDRAAQIVSDELLRIGATNLQAKAIALYASFGDNCWLTDRASAEVLRRWDGRRYHRGSIGRVRRSLAQRGFIESRRIFPSQRLPSGFRSSQGTTNKRILWNVIGKK